jgi:hypothetical protein
MEEKLINLVKNEFKNDFGIFIEDNNTELHLVGRLCSRAFVVFTVAQEYNEYTLKPDIIETRFMIMKMLPKIKPLKTEEQVVALIKYTYQYLKDRYNNVK